MNKFKSAFIKVGHALGILADVDKVFHQFTPQAKTAAVQTFADVLAFVAAASAAGAEKGANFSLDAAVLASAKQLYNDAISDIQTARAVFEALGLSVPATPAAKPAA